MKPESILRLERLTCVHESSGSSSDDVYVKIIVSNGPNASPTVTRFPGGDDDIDMDTGDNKYLDINIDVLFNSSVTIEVYDWDAGDDDLLAQFVIHKVYDLKESDVLDDPYSPRDDAIYTLSYRLIKHPIKTLRVHGIRCQKASLGVNMVVVDAVAGSLEDCAAAVSEIFGSDVAEAIPYGDIISLAFDAASAVLSALPELIEWLAEVINNPDDVFMIHLDATGAAEGIAAEGGFFPPDKDSYEMLDNREDMKEVRFEEVYSEYFRFPLDKGPVKIQLREYDPIKKNISLGSVEIDPDTHPMGEPAKVLTACEPREYEGNTEGAIYHFCYSVGLDDWLKPAKAEVQNALE